VGEDVTEALDHPAAAARSHLVQKGNDTGMCRTVIPRRSGRRVAVGAIPMEDVSRAFEKGETLGMMKIVVDTDSKEILGAAILGTGGDEAIHCILDTMYAKAPHTVLQRAMHIHPTVAEFIPSLLDDLRTA
jgi:pyruvate/2-oxoglutarate dehydrogenase complex dihydrolipoamide dehydrogenase (E3) component